MDAMLCCAVCFVSFCVLHRWIRSHDVWVWYGMGMVSIWYGHGMGMVWIWHGYGMGMVCNTMHVYVRYALGYSNVM